MTLEQHIEDLRAELQNASEIVERRQISFEIEMAKAELVLMIAEQEGLVDAEPPF